MADTLIQLRTRCLVFLNDLTDEVAATGDRYRTTFINRVINDVISHYERLLNSHYQGYLNTNTSLNALADTRSYALGSTFRSPIYQVRRVVNNTDYFLNPITPYNGVLSTISIPNDSWLPAWYLEGNSIVFTDAPSSNETGAMTIKHQLILTDLTTDSSTLEDQLVDAEDCIVLKSTIRLLKAKDVSGALKNISGWERELKESERAFFMQVGNRYVKPDKPQPTSNEEAFGSSSLV